MNDATDPTPHAGDRVKITRRGRGYIGRVAAVRTDPHLGTYYVVRGEARDEPFEVNRFPNEVKVMFT